MSITRWFGNYAKRVTRHICICCLISFSICSHAQGLNPESFAGRWFWYEPSHDQYVTTEFYNSPDFTAPMTRIARKTRIYVLKANKSWFVIRFALAPGAISQVFVPAGMFMSRLYREGGTGASKAAFMRASLFEVDPDTLKGKFESKDEESTPALTPKPSSKLKPWQKYKENWGGITPPPKKNKYLLLDDIKQPEQPDPAQ